MKWLNGYRIRLVLVGFAAAILAGGGGKVYGDFTFGQPVNLGPTINSPALDAHPSISADGLSLFFYSERSGGYGNRDIWVATRATTDEEWTTLENVGPPVNTSYRDSGPAISADALTLFFDSDRPGGSGDSDIWVTTRATDSDPWGMPVNLGPIVNASSYDAYPNISADGLVLFLMSDRAGGLGGNDLWFTSRATKNDPWTTPVNLGPTVNTSDSEGDPSISPDGLALFFPSQRPGGYGSSDLYVARRATTKDPWSPPINLGPAINSPSMDFGPSVSAHGSTLYFVSLRSGSGDLLWAPIIRIVDFNYDGKADIKDLLILIEHWDQNYPLCDIGPMPWGDGVVDRADLEVLMNYWGQEFEFLPFDIRACWKFDETEGSVAEDRAGDNHGTVYGEPQWQPAGGKKAGALAFDGIDDYVSTAFVLDPAAGPFSVLAWIKGGAPGQAIISQTDGPNGTGETWLGADTLEGKLMTGLRPPGQRGPTPPMVSDAVITNGEWHHVGLVVSAYQARELYADGMRVACDTQTVKLPSSDGGLYFGADKALGASTFFSGLIDDVRIYDAALSADKIAALAQ